MTDDNIIHIEYIPLGQARLWDENPKKHDLAALTDSIYRYGFQDPPKFDESLGGLSSAMQRQLRTEYNRFFPKTYQSPF